MAMCSFADPFSMFDVTPVENLFIEEYMLRAPGDFVKVYIYGLRLCYHPVEGASVTTIASALGLEEKTVLDAFAYWERQHVLRRTGDNPPSYSYNNLKALMVSGHNREDDIPQMDRSFNTALQELFGTRLLQAQDYERVYGWIEELGFKPEAVLMLVKHCIASGGRGTAVTFASIEKEALRWAKKGATTLVAAEEHLRTLSANYEGAQKVVRQFGLRRAPTVDEERMYAKWSEEWGFTLDAIMYACRETTKISNPNFNYLDKVLENRYKKQISTSAEMAEAEKSRRDTMGPVREVLETLGLKGVAPTQELANLYADWTSMGFNHEAILIAAQRGASSGRNSMEDISGMLLAWARRALFTPEAIHAFVHKRRESEQQLRRLFEAAGINRGVANADHQLLETWISRGYSMDLMMAAAEASKNAGDPMSYMGSILDNWAARGIRSVEAARAERQRFAENRKAQTSGQSTVAATAVQNQNTGNRPSKEVGAHRYEQRTYTDEELDMLLYTDLDVLNS